MEFSFRLESLYGLSVVHRPADKQEPQHWHSQQGESDTDVSTYFPSDVSAKATNGH